MISKITVFYVDGTFEDVDSGYWFSRRDPQEDGSSKKAKEIIIYFEGGSYQKIIATQEEPKIPIIDPTKVRPFPNQDEIDKRGWPKKYEPHRMFPTDPYGPWCDKTTIVD